MQFMSAVSHAAEHDAAPENAPQVKLCQCHHFPEGFPTPLPPLPKTSSAGAEVPLVSIVVPTYEKRHWAHETLYRCFAHQTHTNKELLVLDTGFKPSPFFTDCSDPRVKYTFVPFHKGLSVDDALKSLRQLALPGSQPPWNTDFPAWREALAAWKVAWKPTTDALERLEADARELAAKGLDTSKRANEQPPPEALSAVFRAVQGAAAHMGFMGFGGGAASSECGFSLGAKRNWCAIALKPTTLSICAYPL